MDLIIGATIMISGVLLRRKVEHVPVVIDEKSLLRRRIKSIKKEQDVMETEMKSRRRLMELHEKRMDLIANKKIRKLQVLTNQLEGLEPPERNHEVENNEYYLYNEILDEINELDLELGKYYL